LAGPKQAKKFDTYLEPLVEELQQLWDGVSAFDGSESPIGPRSFTLRGICMHTMHDFPGYAHLSGLQTSGYRACPCCGEHLQAERSNALKKIVYMGYTKYLPIDHPMREDEDLVGHNNIDLRPIPIEPDGIDWQVLWWNIENEHISKERSGMMRLSILYRLPYWEVYFLFICMY
jgi:hypothetical protein